ncbi:MAG TPA: cell division protein FtsQ [Anseongella sp.]|nr:cell division protein FtsQ [Anseongella sp.]
MKGKTLFRTPGPARPAGKLARTVWILLLAGGLIGLMGFMHKKQSKVMCKSMEIVIPGEKFFVLKEEIRSIVHETDSTILWYPINYARLRSLETAIRKSPYVEEASVYADVNGVLKIEIKQRSPLVRVINQRNAHFYMDGKGFKIPLSPNYTPKVLVATGYIDEPFGAGADTAESELSGHILRLAKFIEGHEFWKAQIGQVYINQDKEMELIPRVGDHRILIGDTDNLEEKMDKLWIFYKKAMPRVGWDTYETINIKYGNQIIGVRDTI